MRSYPLFRKRLLYFHVDQPPIAVDLLEVGLAVQLNWNLAVGRLFALTPIQKRGLSLFTAYRKNRSRGPESPLRGCQYPCLAIDLEQDPGFGFIPIFPNCGVDRIKVQ